MMKTGKWILSFALLLAGLSFQGRADVPVAEAASSTEASLIDLHGREINAYGIDLVDWQGYLANPYVKLTVRPPASATYPVTITLRAQGSSRLMMNVPSTLSATGATKTLTFSSVSEQKSFLLEIAPDRVGGPGSVEQYNLAVEIRESNGATRVQNIPIRVYDQDDNRDTSFPLVFDYRFDTINGYFNDPAIRAAAEQAIKDWFYFFDLQPFDTVPAGDEVSYVPNDNFQGNTRVTNNAPYNGEWIFLRGINGPYSTGWSANNGKYHTRNGVRVPGPIQRSLGVALDFYPDAVVFTSLNDDDWYKTDLYQVTDVYGLIMHEFGHGFAFNQTWPGIRNYVETGGVNDQDVIAYQGRAVPVDPNGYHIPDDPQYYDRLSGQSAGWRALFPTRRWMLNKLTLLIAENAGWPLNRNLTPFLAPSITTSSLPGGVRGQTYYQKLSVSGGIPFYDWTIESGSLPPGLSLNRFTGEITGTLSSSASQNSYTFTVRLKDGDELQPAVTKTFTINVSGGSGGTTAGLIAHYRFDETSGTTAADASGNGRTATLNGGATWTAGRSGNAVSLNGTNGYVSLPAGIVSGLSDFTISTWVRVNSNSDWARIFDFGNGTTQYMFLTADAGGTPGVRFAITTNGSGNEQRITVNTPLATGVWKHVAVTKSGSTGILYIDGVEVARNTNMTLAPSNLGNTTQNWIGRSQYGWDPYLNAAVDDFRIYNRALGAAEIGALVSGS